MKDSKFITLNEAARASGYSDASTLRKAARSQKLRVKRTDAGSQDLTTLEWVSEWEQGRGKVRGGCVRGKGKKYPDDHLSRELLMSGECCTCERCMGRHPKKWRWTNEVTPEEGTSNRTEGTSIPGQGSTEARENK